MTTKLLLKDIDQVLVWWYEIIMNALIFRFPGESVSPEPMGFTQMRGRNIGKTLFPSDLLS